MYSFPNIENFEVISFDIFDTLVYRSFMTPQDVFSAVEYKYKEEAGIDLKNFRKDRIEAEEKTRRESHKEDVTLDDIYNNISITNKESIKKIECEIEITTAQPNINVVNFLKQCRDQDKRIIIVTDMYLPREVIIQLLQNCGVSTGLYERLYISGEDGLTKYTGHLYQHVLKDIKISPQKILHIGDNVRNDYRNAKQYGINSFLIERQSRKLPHWNIFQYEETLESNHIKKFILNSYYNKSNPLDEIGYNILGPILYSYCLWLHQIHKTTKDSAIIFLSREGYLIHKAYSVMFPNDSDKFYLEINRNTLLWPMLFIDSSFSSFLKNIPNEKKHITIRYIFNKLLGNKKNNINHFNKDGLLDYDTDYTPEELLNNSDFIETYNRIVNKQKKEYENQYNLLIEYMHDVLTYNTLILVNNSMTASAQIKLNKILSFSGLNNKIINLHFIRDKKISDRRLLYRIWFEEKCPEISKAIFFAACIIFETMLFPDAGTALYYYSKDEGKILVKNDEVDNIQDSIQQIQRLQNHSIRFIKDYLDHFPMPLSADVCLRIWCDFIKKPSYFEAEAFSRIFDKDDGNIKPFVKKYRLICINKEIHRSWWPQGSFVYSHHPALANIYNLIFYLMFKNSDWE